MLIKIVNSCISYKICVREWNKDLLELKAKMVKCLYFLQVHNIWKRRSFKFHGDECNRCGKAVKVSISAGNFELNLMEVANGGGVVWRKARDKYACALVMKIWHKPAEATAEMSKFFFLQTFTVASLKCEPDFNRCSWSLETSSFLTEASFKCYVIKKITFLHTPAPLAHSPSPSLCQTRMKCLRILNSDPSSLPPFPIFPFLLFQPDYLILERPVDLNHLRSFTSLAF